jgi:hypothetical protein
VDIHALCLRSRGGEDMSEFSPVELQGVEAVVGRQHAQGDRYLSQARNRGPRNLCGLAGESAILKSVPVPALDMEQVEKRELQIPSAQPPSVQEHVAWPTEPATCSSRVDEAIADDRKNFWPSSPILVISKLAKCQKLLRDVLIDLS